MQKLSASTKARSVDPAAALDDLAMQDRDLPGGPAERDEAERRPEPRGFGERGLHAVHRPPRPGSEHFRRVGAVRASLRVARFDEVASDHLVVGLAGADHRIHAGVRIDDDFEERRALELDEFPITRGTSSLRSSRTANR